MNDTKHVGIDLDAIEPLVAYYTGEIGELAGRLMAALSFLVDLESSQGWDRQDVRVLQSVHYSRELVASVLRIVADAQLAEGDEFGMAEAIGRSLDELSLEVNDTGCRNGQ